MIIVRIRDGLGNQMFMYAYGKALEKRGYKVKFDLSYFQKQSGHNRLGLDKYNIKADYCTKAEAKKFYSRLFIHRILGKLGLRRQAIIYEQTFEFDEKLLTPPDNYFIAGYFQNEKYFKDIISELRQEFTLKGTPSEFTQRVSEQIRTIPNSCSLHVRRGDFIIEKNIQSHGAVPLDYYHQAITYMEKEKGDTQYFIFSDDIPWCRENLTFIKNAIFVESNEPRIPQEDIYLMSLCQNHIIANSTFSWWGAYLNPNPNKLVIAPKKLYNSERLNTELQGLMCPEWIRL